MNSGWKKAALLSATMVVLCACTSVPIDRGQAQTQALLQSHSRVAGQIALNHVDPDGAILRQPLDADACVRVALLRNPLMRSWYAQLGIAQADVYDAARLSNPSLGFAQLSAHDRVTKTTWSVSQPFLELLFLNFNTHAARGQLLQTQQRIAHEVLSLEAQTRRAYYQYVGAALMAQLRSKAAATATLSSQFAQRLYAAGNISQLQLSREQATASAASIAQRKAQAQRLAARGALLTVLGVTMNDSNIAFIEQLPLPTTERFDVVSLQDWAVRQRLDLLATRTALANLQRGVAQTSRWRWLGGVELGAEWERDGNEASVGPRANLQLPLFNRGGGKVLRARAATESLQAQLDALELATHNEVAVQISELDQAAAIVDEYRERLLPLQEQVVSLSQQQQNFMLIGAFELLSTKQNELDVYQAYLEAVRDYWLAHTELMRVAGGTLPNVVEDSGVTIGIDNNSVNSPTQNPAADDHTHHAQH